MMEEQEELVIFEKVSKDYRSFRVLDNLSLEIRKGDILGYVGPNGAGKTTTIKAMVGLISDFQGRLSIGGYAMPKERSKAHRLIGYLPQNVAFQEWRTVEHVLSTFGALSEIDKRDLDSRMEEALKIVGIEEYRHKKIIELSGGNVQKVGLAQAILHEPALLILDEPLAGLDPTSRYNVKQILKDLSKKGSTVFFSSHILSDVQDVATRIAILNQGRLMKVGTIEDLTSEFKTQNTVVIDIIPPIEDIRGLRTLPGILAVETPFEGRLLANIDPSVDIDAASNSIIRKLLDDGHTIKSFGAINPNLDELYIRYVTEGFAR